jgi:glycerate 2-kinase
MAEVYKPVVVIAPDSFKGSLSAHEVADAMARGIIKVFPEAVVQLCPMADGGEGTIDAMIANGGTKAPHHICGADGQAKAAWIGTTANGNGIVESAGIVGLTEPCVAMTPVEERTTYGIGEAIRACLDAGRKTIYVALGGTSTNDGGAGMLAALGARLLDAHGNVVPAQPKNFHNIAQLDLSHLDQRLASVRIIGMSDVENPLCGANGATAVFGPQKGVTDAQIDTLDSRLAHFAEVVERATGVSSRHVQGAGAAGGLGFALLSIGAELRSGAVIVANEVGLPAMLDGADWLITGEGRSDMQTLAGKAPAVAARFACEAGVPATPVSGSIDIDAVAALSRIFSGCFSPINQPMSLDQAIDNAQVLIESATSQLASLQRGLN